MTIIGVGVDTACISRFEDKEDIAKRVLSESEFAEYIASVDKASYLASRFAIKEAYVKASSDKMVDYRRLTLRKDESGKPSLLLDCKPLKAFVSLSHDQNAVAIVILYQD